MKGRLSLIFTLFVGAFSACSDDDDSSSSISLTNTKWYSSDVDYSIGSDYIDIEKKCVYFYFYSNKEGLMYTNTMISSSDMGSSIDPTVFFFTYTVKGSNINIDYVAENGFNMNSLKIANSTHLTYEPCSLSFRRTTLTASDRTWIYSLHGSTGTCSWYSNLANNLYIVGNGPMANYTSFEKTPWADRIPNYVYLSDGVSYIGNYAFANPSIWNFSEFQDNLNITHIGKGAFKGTLISSFSDKWKTAQVIDDEAFADCKYLSSLSGLESCQKIGANAFNGCKNLLAYLVDMKQLKTIGDFAFLKARVCGDLPESLESVGNGAIPNYTAYTLTLPASLKSIGSYAFGGSSITKIEIGPNLKQITAPAFNPKSTGSIYINQLYPPNITQPILDSDKMGKWTLYVPEGTKSRYENSTHWKGFKSIVETSTLRGW